MAEAKRTDWSQYGRCTAVPCDAYPGEPCVDGRTWPPPGYRRPLKKTAHSGRPKTATGSLPPEGES